MFVVLENLDIKKKVVYFSELLLILSIRQLDINACSMCVCIIMETQYIHSAG